MLVAERQVNLPDGRTLSVGTLSDAAALCGVKPNTYSTYRTLINAPGPILVPSMTSDGLTPLRGDDGRELYDLNEVRDFHMSRPGQGRWSERASIESLRPTAVRVALLRDADAGRLALDPESGRVLVDRLVNAPQVRRKVAGTVTELRSLGALDGPDEAGRLTLSGPGHALLARFTRKDG